MIAGIAAQDWRHPTVVGMPFAASTPTAYAPTAVVPADVPFANSSPAAFAPELSLIAPFSAVVLLIGANGTNGSTAFVDESSHARTLTANGNAQISTTSPKFGSGCMLFDGTGDFISTPTTTDFDLSGGVYTVESWIDSAELSEFTIASLWSATAGNTCWALFSTGGSLLWRFVDSSGGINDTAAGWSPAIGTYSHVAVSQNAAGVVRMWIDGALEAETSPGVVPRYASGGALNVGRSSGFSSIDLNGRLDELRITKGYTQYDTAGSITVPAAAFPRS